MFTANIRIRKVRLKLFLRIREFVEVRITKVKGKEPLDANNRKLFKKFVEFYHDEIVRKWVDFFVYNKVVVAEKITKKI